MKIVLWGKRFMTSYIRMIYREKTTLFLFMENLGYYQYEVYYCLLRISDLNNNNIPQYFVIMCL